MATWYLNRALTNFRDAVNARYPGRDKESDGTIGDEAHQETSSDHNPDPAGEPDAGSVDAWDMDVEVNGVSQPYAVDVEVLKDIFEKHESSRYWIHADQIARRSNSWKREPYTGSNRHLKHVHFNTRESHENSDAPWIIPGGSMTTVDNIWRLLHDGLRPPGTNETINGVPIAWLPRQFYEIDQQLVAIKAAIEAITGGNVDAAVILAGVEEKLQTLKADLMAQLPDAVVDEHRDRLHANDEM